MSAPVAALAVFVLVRFGVWWAGLFIGLAVAGAAGISWHLFSANGVLFDALGPGLGLVLVFYPARPAAPAGNATDVRETAAAGVIPPSGS